jgi:hypothetical protein
VTFGETDESPFRSDETSDSSFKYASLGSGAPTTSEPSVDEYGRHCHFTIKALQWHFICIIATTIYIITFYINLFSMYS